MHVSIVPEYKRVERKKPREMYVLARVESATETASGPARAPIHLAIVLDRSGSMDGAKIEAAKNAAQGFMRSLTRNDYLCIVAFDEQVEVLVPHQRLTEKDRIALDIERLVAGTTTNLSGGWLRALSEIRQHFHAGHVHRVILLTDGIANRGVTESEQLFQIAEKNRQRRIVTTAVGFGMDFNEDTLRGIAEHGGGNFYYVDQPEALAQAFGAEFGDVVSVIGQNLELTLTAAEGVSLLEVIGDLPELTSSKEYSGALGDVRADEFRQLVFKIGMPAERRPGDLPVAQVRVRYDAVGGDFDTVELDAQATVSVADECEIDEDVRTEVWMAQGIDLRLQAKKALRTGHELTDVARKLRSHADRLEEHRMPTKRMRDEQARLRKLAEDLLERDIDINALRKAVTEESFVVTKVSGRILRGVKEAEGEFGPDRPENLLDIGDRLDQLMRKQGYDPELRDRALQVLRELGENAIEHGCKARPGARARAWCLVTRSYVRITVEDDGPGFDVDATLEELAKVIDGDHRRGRGLLLVKGLADFIRHSDNGRHIEALIKRERIKLEIQAPPSASYDIKGNVVVIRLTGALDAGTISELESFLDRIISEGWDRLVLDVGNVAYIASVGFGVLLRAFRQLEPLGGRMAIAGPKPEIRHAFNLLGFPGIIPILGSVEEALQQVVEA